jgi:hypothetical protein
MAYSECVTVPFVQVAWLALWRIAFHHGTRFAQI